MSPFSALFVIFMTRTNKETLSGRKLVRPVKFRTVYIKYDNKIKNKEDA